jgi:hypothetical protein
MPEIRRGPESCPREIGGRHDEGASSFSETTMQRKRTPWWDLRPTTPIDRRTSGAELRCMVVSEKELGLPQQDTEPEDQNDLDTKASFVIPLSPKQPCSVKERHGGICARQRLSTGGPAVLSEGILVIQPLPRECPRLGVDPKVVQGRLEEGTTKAWEVGVLSGAPS